MAKQWSNHSFPLLKLTLDEMHGCWYQDSTTQPLVSRNINDVIDLLQVMKLRKPKKSHINFVLTRLI